MFFRRIGLVLMCAGMAAGGAMARAEEAPVHGFVDRVYRGEEGAESKYVVFLPSAYDGKTDFPAIVFLHGAGHTGTDGRDQLTGALAEAIRGMETTFAFIAVFPQSQKGGWQADTEDGKRVLAILDDVAKTYRVDATRISLTGVSMGGEGTWSLGTAHADRWAAIVPVAGGGDVGTAATFKNLPCWCFHGDADEVIPVNQSRAMIRALKSAGGRPLFTELRRMGHDQECWARVYGDPDLYEWLLMQRRKGDRNS